MEVKEEGVSRIRMQTLPHREEAGLQKRIWVQCHWRPFKEDLMKGVELCKDWVVNEICMSESGPAF